MRHFKFYFYSTIERKESSILVDILFEEKVKDRWKGRTPTNKLVFAASQKDLRGQVRLVKIDWTGPWSMIGSLV